MGIKGDIGQQVSEMFEELGSSVPLSGDGMPVHGTGPAGPRDLHDDSVYFEHPSFLKGQPAVTQPPSANPEGRHTGHIGRATGMKHTHNTARGNKEVRGTNWRADLIHNAIDSRPLDEIFNDPAKGGPGRSR